MNTEQLLKQQENIRLISVIAHVDHGKTTLTDSLLSRAGLIDEEQAGAKRGTDTMEEEKERGITIRSTGVTMTFHNNIVPGLQDCVVHLVDSPGHVDFSSEVTAALRVSDGALVVVDCVEGPRVQTETVLRQALSERVKPVLVLNKIDRAVLELQHTPEDAYERFQKTIAAVNAVMESYEDSALGDVMFDPTKGNVVFASGLFGWGFTLPQFAAKIAAKTGGDPDKILKRLWGDHFFDPETKKVGKSPVSASGKKLERYATQIILDPIFKMVKGLMDDDAERLDKLVASGYLPQKERESKKGKDLMKAAMRRFLPLADALLGPIFSYLPSPIVAQKYRAEVLYDGDMDDELAKAIKACDASGPLVAFVSKMFPVPNTKSFYAFGRVFSGTVKAGQKVYLSDPNSTVKIKDNSGKSVQGILALGIKALERLEECPCGNIVALSGIDGMLVKSGTLSDIPNAPGQIRSMKFSVAPVVRVAVTCKNPQDLPKLIDGLRALAKVDPCVQCTIDQESKEHIIGAAGDLHSEVCIRVLQNDYCKGVELIVSEPMVPFRETIIGETEEQSGVLVKSSNKHNRIYAKASPIGKELCDAIDNKEIQIQEDSVARARTLVDKFGWDFNDAKQRIWCFGPEQEATNALVNASFGIQYINQIRDSAMGAFKWATNEGPLCGEPVRGVRIDLVDVILHADAMHRGGGQIIPAAKRLVHAAMLSAKPRLMEPIFLVEVQSTNEYTGNIYSVLLRKRGHVIAEEPREGTPIVVIKAYLPVLESFGLTAALREACHGQAFPQCSMSHWQVVDGDPYEEGTLAHSIVQTVRQRKKMPSALPQLSELADKL